MARTSHTASKKRNAKKTGLKQRLEKFKYKKLAIFVLGFAIIGTVIILRSAAAPQSPSGQAVPVGDLNGWKQIFVEDFTKDAAVGSWGTTEAEKIVYTGANGTQWTTYPQGWNDTYGGKYRPDQVLSVGSGVLNFNLHHVDGYQAGANPSPVIKSGSGSVYDRKGQLYGRYAARFRVTNASSLQNYYAAWLLWPMSGVWNDGEIDFPEGSLSNNVGGFHHCVGNASQNCGWTGDTGVKFSDWHTYVIEWTPNYVKFILDDKVVMNYTDKGNIPNKPMRWQLQTETKNDGGSSSAQGNLELDWVAVYQYSPNTTVSTTTPAPTPSPTPTPEPTPSPAPTPEPTPEPKPTPTTPNPEPAPAPTTPKPTPPTTVVVSGTVSVVDPGTTPTKVTVTANGKPVKVSNGQVNTKNLKNGIYKTEIKTTDSSGKITTKTLTVEVKNKLSFWDRLRQFFSW